MSNVNYSVFAVRLGDGSIDLDATVEKFQAGLLEYAEKSRFDLTETVNAIEKVYNGPGMKLGSRLNCEALVSATMGVLGASPAVFGSVKERVLALVKTHPRIHQAHGRNGGVCWVPEGYKVEENKLVEIPQAAE